MRIQRKETCANVVVWVDLCSSSERDIITTSPKKSRVKILKENIKMHLWSFTHCNYFQTRRTTTLFLLFQCTRYTRYTSVIHAICHFVTTVFGQFSIYSVAHCKQQQKTNWNYTTFKILKLCDENRKYRWKKDRWLIQLIVSVDLSSS